MNWNEAPDDFLVPLREVPGLLGMGRSAFYETVRPFMGVTRLSAGRCGVKMAEVRRWRAKLQAMRESV